MSKKVQVLAGQSLADIAIQEYGNIGGLSLLMEDNKNLITDITAIAPGTMLTVRTPVPALKVTNKQVVNFFADNYTPATWQLE